MIIEEMQKLQDANATVQVDTKSRDQLLRELREYEDQVPEWNHQNTLWSMLYEVDNGWNYPTSKFFIALPLDLDS